jgi:hypothetical protein
LGSRNIHFKDVYDVEEAEWNGRALAELQQQASSRAHEVAWKLRDSYSTATEARTLGQLLAIRDLAELNRIAAVIEVAEGDLDVNSNFIDAVSGLIRDLICVGDHLAHQTAARLAVQAEGSGINATVVASWTEAAAHATKSLAPSGYLWMVKVSALDEPADVALKKTLAGTNRSHQRVVQRGRLIPVSAISDLHQNDAGWIMSEMFAHQSGPGVRQHHG